MFTLFHIFNGRVMIILELQDNMTMDYEERYFHGKPQNSFHSAVHIPDVVVFPR